MIKSILICFWFIPTAIKQADEGARSHNFRASIGPKGYKHLKYHMPGSRTAHDIPDHGKQVSLILQENPDLAAVTSLNIDRETISIERSISSLSTLSGKLPGGRSSKMTLPFQRCCPRLTRPTLLP